MGYVKGALTYEAACDSIKHVLSAHFLSSGKYRCKMDANDEAELITKCLQCRSWDRTVKIVGTHPAKLKTNLRSNIGRWAMHFEAVKLQEGV